MRLRSPSSPSPTLASQRGDASKGTPAAEATPPSRREQPFDVQVILQREAWRASRQVYAARIGIGALALVNGFAVWSANAPAHMWAITAIAAGYLGLGVAGWRALRHERWHRLLAVVGVGADTLTVSLASLASLHNHSGALETLNAPVIGLLYLMFTMLTVLQHSPGLSLFAAAFAAAQRAAIVLFLVGTGRVATSATSHYGHETVNLGDQFTIIAFILVSGGIAAWASYSARRSLLAAATAASERRELERRESRYQKYLPTGVVDEVSNPSSPLGERWERRESVVLCTRLVGLSRFAETRDAEQVAHVIRQHMTLLDEVIFRHGGTLERITESGAVAVFGLLCELPDAAGAAVRASLELQRRASAVGATPGAPTVVATGAAKGAVLAGHLGSKERLQYAVLGRAAARASHLADLAERGGAGILVDDAVHDLVASWVQAERVMEGNTTTGEGAVYHLLDQAPASASTFEPTRRSGSG